MSDSDFWLPLCDAEGAASKRFRELDRQAAGEPVMAELGPLSWRADWEDGSFVACELLDVAGGLFLRLGWAVRAGDVQEQAWELSPWVRPEAGPVRMVGGQGPVRSLEGGVMRGHPLGGDPPSAAEALRLLDPMVFAEPASPDLSGLSERAREVLADLDGRRVRAGKAKSYPPCVVCSKPVGEGDLYEHQAGSASPRRRVHVECLRSLGLSL